MKRILFALLIGIVSCDSDDNVSILLGVYTEVEPQNGRTQLMFFNGNTVIKSESGNPIEDAFYYQITGDKIILTPISDSSLASELEFDLVDNSQFVIENLYVGIPESPKIYMTFRK